MATLTKEDIKDIAQLMGVKTLTDLKKKIQVAKGNKLKVGATKTFMQTWKWNGIDWEPSGKGFFTAVKGQKVGTSYGQKKNKIAKVKAKKEEENVFLVKSLSKVKSDEVEEW